MTRLKNTPSRPARCSRRASNWASYCLSLSNRQAALREFETSLRSAPNRFNGLYGAARAAKLAADRRRAKTYYGKLLALCRQADSPRAEIEEAKQFLASVNVPDSVSTR